MAKMSVLRGESKIAGTRSVSKTFIRKIKNPSFKRYYKTVETSMMVCSSVKSVKENMVMLVMHETRGWSVEIIIIVTI